MRINIVGDIAGNYIKFLELLSIMPEADLTIAAGDLIDRGPQSDKVIQWFIDNPNSLALYGNHEDMMLSAIEDPRYLTDWLRNGGAETIHSYGGIANIPAEHIEFIQCMKLFFHIPGTEKEEGLLVTHAPNNQPPDDRTLHNYMWNRKEPGPPPENIFLVHGHNWIETDYKAYDGRIYGTCIDNCGKGQLVGIHWPTKEKFRVKIK